MLGARIDVMQPQIRNLIAYLLPLPDKKPRTAVVKRDKTSGLDRNHRQKYSRLQHTLLIRKGSIKYCLLLLCARLKISCISRLCCVWNNVCVHVCKTSNWWFIIICNCIYIVVIIVAGGWMGRWVVLGMVNEGGDWVVLTSHFYGGHKGSWKSTATLCTLCALYCGLTVLKLIW